MDSTWISPPGLHPVTLWIWLSPKSTSPGLHVDSVRSPWGVDWKWRRLEKDWRWTDCGLEVDSMDEMGTARGLHEEPWGSVRYSFLAYFHLYMSSFSVSKTCTTDKHLRTGEALQLYISSYHPSPSWARTPSYPNQSYIQVRMNWISQNDLWIMSHLSVDGCSKILYHVRSRPQTSHTHLDRGLIGHADRFSWPTFSDLIANITLMTIPTYQLTAFE